MTAAPPARSERLLATIAAISGAYDILLGLSMLAGRGFLGRAFGVPAPAPPIHADLNGLFLLAIGAGYYFPWRRPSAWRAYLWVMGPFLKGAGAALFVADYLLRGSPAAFLVFALTDGTLAAVTWWALVRNAVDHRADSRSAV